jgi:hypothetical protein
MLEHSTCLTRSSHRPRARLCSETVLPLCEVGAAAVAVAWHVHPEGLAH